MPRYSLVVPFYQEAGNVRPLMGRARAVLDGLDPDWEAVLVDDGSTDGTAAELAEEEAADPRCRVISLGRNTGQAAALLRGLREARGAVILAMDGDGQNDPADFPAVLGPLLGDSADVVCGRRVDRRDGWGRRLASRVANAVRRCVLRDGVHDAGCQLRALRREVVASLEPTWMMQTFLPAMAVAAGFRVREIPVRHHPRLRGASKYGVGNLSLRPCAELAAAWWRLRVRGGRPRCPRG